MTGELVSDRSSHPGACASYDDGWTPVVVSLSHHRRSIRIDMHIFLSVRDQRLEVHCVRAAPPIFPSRRSWADFISIDVGGEQTLRYLEEERLTKRGICALTGHDQSPCPRRSVGGDRAASAVRAAWAQGWAITDPRQRRAGGSPDHAARWAVVGVPAAGDGSRLGPVMLVAAACLTGGGRGGGPAPRHAGTAEGPHVADTDSRRHAAASQPARSKIPVRSRPSHFFRTVGRAGTGPNSSSVGPG